MTKRSHFIHFNIKYTTKKAEVSLNQKIDNNLPWSVLLATIYSQSRQNVIFTCAFKLVYRCSHFWGRGGAGGGQVGHLT